MFEYMSKCILAYRKKLGMTQEQLAEKLGTSAVAVSKCERGISVPELGLICQMADLFQLSVDELLGRANCLLVEEEKYSDNAMKQFDLETRKNIIEKYAEKECKVELIEEMAELDDKVIQLILKKLNNTTLLYALSGASGKICVRFLENVSGRMLSFLDYHLGETEQDIEKMRYAQNTILQIASVVHKN